MARQFIQAIEQTGMSNLLKKIIYHSELNQFFFFFIFCLTLQSTF